MRLHLLVLTGTLLAAIGAAQASGDTFRATNPKWKAECGSCHVAYPARLLPAESWKALMAGLDKHFGSDASLDAATTTEILAFLEKNASQRKPDPAVKPQLRITETNWFKREHDEVPAATWKNPLVKSAANCAACHIQAEQGDFNEHSIRLPK
jgi:hypothetical protein